MKLILARSLNFPYSNPSLIGSLCKMLSMCNSSNPGHPRLVKLSRGLVLRALAITATIATALAIFAEGLFAQPSPVLGPSRPETPGMDAGEVLLGEYNCVACHQADAAVTTRLASRRSPRLG